MPGSLSPIQVNFWQTSVRTLFKFYQAQAGLTQYEAWTCLREELQFFVANWDPPAEEWEFKLVQAILVGEHDCTLEEANAMDERSPDATPIIAALKACIWKSTNDMRSK